MTGHLRRRRAIPAAQLREFEIFCSLLGWKSEQARDGEALRMRHSDREQPLIVYAKDAPKPIYTVWDESARLWWKFRRAERPKGEGA